jgi:hypothetical protein
MRTITLSLLMGTAAAGCQRPARPESPTATTIKDEDVQAVWDSALAVLQKHDFRPDRQDRTGGVIITFPTTSMQWHEPWRQDVADAYGLGEASLHTIQRKATVRFIHGAEHGRSDRNGESSSPPQATSQSSAAGGLKPQAWTLDVQVDVYRLSVPEYQLTSSSSGIHSFDADIPAVTGEIEKSAESARRWVLLGRDGAMEERLLSRILASY